MRNGPRKRAGRPVGARSSACRPFRDEPGCRFYQPCRDPENPDAFLIFEIYDDQAAFEAHGASEHFQEIAVGQAFDLLESRERTFYETI